MGKKEAAEKYVVLINGFEQAGESSAKPAGGEKDGASWALEKPKYQYGAVQDASALRAKSNFGGTLAMNLATSLCARQLKPILDRGASEESDPIGFSWRSDPSLRQAMPGPGYSEEATRAFARNIKCPVLVITALDGMYTTSFRMQREKGSWWDNMFDPQTKVVLAGLHMIAAAKASARPLAAARYIVGAGVAAGLCLGQRSAAIARITPAAVSQLRRSARMPVALAIGLGLAFIAGYLTGPASPDSGTRQKVAQIEGLRNSVQKLECYSQLKHVQLRDGGHHCHMVNPAGTAQAIVDWMAETQ